MPVLLQKYERYNYCDYYLVQVLGVQQVWYIRSLEHHTWALHMDLLDLL